MLRLVLNGDRDLPSQLTRALHGRSIVLATEGPEGLHPYTALATSWRMTSEAIGQAVSELRKLQGDDPDADFKPQAMTQTLKTLIYAATETFDFYAQELVKRLEDGRPKAEVRILREYQAGVKRLRDPIALMCNRMKHNFREIVPARIVSTVNGAMTFVYRLNTAHGGVQRPDAKVHGEVGFASVEKTLHQVVHGLLRADHNAAALVGRLADNGNRPIELTGPMSCCRFGGHAA